jgi:hypothetical protein
MGADDLDRDMESARPLGELQAQGKGKVRKAINNNRPGGLAVVRKGSKKEKGANHGRFSYSPRETLAPPGGRHQRIDAI